MPTLEEALRETAMRRWQGRRCYATNMSQATKAIRDFTVACGPAGAPIGSVPVQVSDVTPRDIRRVTASWYQEGISPATINKRLNCLSAMGVNVAECRVREPKVLKWWLRPEMEAALGAYLRDCRLAGQDDAPHMATFIAWTTRTGLRVEETLRLRRADFHLDSHDTMAVTVPGLKTAEAQATLPLGKEAAALVTERYRHWAMQDDRFIPLSYDQLDRWWEKCRKRIGAEGNPTATLKALRRSAARHLHIAKGMPLDMVRQYLRHENIETTMGYLRLTGGYGTEEMRKWL